MNNILNPGTFGVRLVMYVMLALLVGLMYVNLDDDTDHSGVNSRTSLFFYVAAFFIFMTIAAMPFFMMERSIFEKEKLNKLYGSVPYAFSQTIAAIPGVFLITLISSILIVFMCGLNNFGVFLGDMFLMLLVGEQIAVLFAVLVPHYIIGMALVAGIYGFFMLVEGFMKIYSDLPSYIQWAYYIAIHTYSFRTFMVNEFEEIDEITESTFLTGDDVIEFYDMEDVNVEDDLVYMMLYFLFIFVGTIIALLVKYRSTIPDYSPVKGN